MADDDALPDLFAAVEEVFAAGDSATEVACEAIRELPPPEAEQLRGIAPGKLVVERDLFDPDPEGCTAYDQQEEGDDKLQLDSLLRLFATVGLLISFGWLYILWMFDLGGGEKFQFDLANTWPAIAFGALLLGLCLEQMVGWFAIQCLTIQSCWRHNSLFVRWKAWRRAPRWQHTNCCCWRCKRHWTQHYSHCHCVRCKLARRWTFWRRGKRYRPY